MKKRTINELPEGLRNRMIRLTFELAVLSDRDPEERIKALDAHCITYKRWQTRSYHLMKAINNKLLADGHKAKYVFTQERS